MTDWPGEWGTPQDRWISGDWTEIAPGVKVRGYGLPNEEDCDEPVRIQVIRRTDQDQTLGDPGVWTQQEIDEIMRRARERSARLKAIAGEG